MAGVLPRVWKLRRAALASAPGPARRPFLHPRNCRSALSVDERRGLPPVCDIDGPLEAPAAPRWGFFYGRWGFA